MEQSGVLLYPNPALDRDFAVTLRIRKLLEGEGVPVLVTLPRAFGTWLPEALASLRVSPEEGFARAALCAVFGGDGTILRAARTAAGYGTPILGVNMGNKGFMAGLEADEADLVCRAARGEYTPEKRMMLDVTVLREEETVYTDCALNDAVVSGLANMIPVSVRCAGAVICAFRGDGVIAATPTGSTAYSFSAGGPIVEPTAQNILITPVCAHDLGSRPLVLAPERVAEIAVGPNRGKGTYLTVDGGEPFSLQPGDRVLVRRSEKITVLCNVAGKSFYEKIGTKLGVGT